MWISGIAFPGSCLGGCGECGEGRAAADRRAPDPTAQKGETERKAC